MNKLQVVTTQCLGYATVIDLMSKQNKFPINIKCKINQI